MSHLLMLSLLAQDPAVGLDDTTSMEAVELAEVSSQGDAGVEVVVEQDAQAPVDVVQEGEIEASTQSVSEEQSAVEQDSAALLRGNVGAPPDLELESRGRGASVYRSDNNRWNAHQVGDLVTVVIYDSLKTEVKADTTTSRSSAHSNKIRALFGLVGQVLSANPSMVEMDSGSFGAEGESDSAFSGAGATSRENQVAGVLTCTVVEVLESGNLKISGHKTVTVNGETQFLVLEGVVRPADIGGDNTVASDMLSDATIQTTGTGELADRQHSGVLSRLLNRVFPF